MCLDDSNRLQQFLNLQKTIDLVVSWLASNFLKLNPAKTEFVIINSKAIADPDSCNVTVDGHVLARSDNLKFLGVTIDNELTLTYHIADISRACSWQLFEIRRIRNRLDRSTAETIIRAFIISRIDYCNSIYHGMTAVSLVPLKRILHTAARVITLTRRFDHITPALRDLHWLPIPHRAAYKIVCIVFQCLNGCAPAYLCEQLTYCHSDRLYRERRLQVPLRLSNSFISTGPSTWNTLSTATRNSDLSFAAFKKQLKTELFCNAYE